MPFIAVEYSYCMIYKGVIIEESLENKDLLSSVKIVSTKVVDVTDKHKTPWLKQWTLHTVKISEKDADKVAQEVSSALDKERSHSWYADFKNDKFHYIIFLGKIFKVNRAKPEEYKEVTNYGISLGIPDYQLDFSPDIQ